MLIRVVETSLSLRLWGGVGVRLYSGRPNLRRNWQIRLSATVLGVTSSWLTGQRGLREMESSSSSSSSSSSRSVSPPPNGKRRKTGGKEGEEDEDGTPPDLKIIVKQIGSLAEKIGTLTRCQVELQSLLQKMHRGGGRKYSGNAQPNGAAARGGPAREGSTFRQISITSSFGEEVLDQRDIDAMLSRANSMRSVASSQRSDEEFAALDGLIGISLSQRSHQTGGPSRGTPRRKSSAGESVRMSMSPEKDGKIYDTDESAATPDAQPATEATAREATAAAPPTASTPSSTTGSSPSIHEMDSSEEQQRGDGGW